MDKRAAIAIRIEIQDHIDSEAIWGTLLVVLNVGTRLLTPDNGKDWRHIAVGDTLHWLASTDAGRTVVVTAIHLAAAFPPHRSARINSASDWEETGLDIAGRPVPQLSSRPVGTSG